MHSVRRGDQRDGPRVVTRGITFKDTISDLSIIKDFG